MNSELWTINISFLFAIRFTLYAIPSRVFMHKINQRGDVLNRSVLQDTVTQIENVAGFAFDPVENPGRLGFDLGNRSKKNHRVQITLHGDVAAQLRPSRGQVDAPINADNIAAGGFEQRQHIGRAGAEMDQRDG